MYTNKNILREIPSFSNWQKVDPIYKGWSNDLKYKIHDKSGEKYLLKLSHIKELDAKQLEFSNMQKLSELEVPMSIPLEFGICDQGKRVYSLFTWVEGEEAEELLPKLDVKDQYNFGLKAGEILRKVHSISVPDGLHPWGEIYKPKIEKAVHNYLNCGVKIKHDHKVIDFLAKNKHILNKVEQTFQHGDFHVGNMIINSSTLNIIDFNRSGYGDPWEEYDRYIFTWRISIPFAQGQIYSYFNGEVPDEFFRKLALYNATNLLASISWSIPFGDKDVQTAVDNAEKIIDSYRGFSTYIPSWYTRN